MWFLGLAIGLSSVFLVQEAQAFDLEPQQRWDDTVFQIRQKVHDALKEEKCIHTFSEQLPRLEKGFHELEVERDQVLEDLRTARFCQGCGKTARELQKMGVTNSEQHFLDNGGTRPATPEEIAAKTEFYSTEVTRKSAQIDSGRAQLKKCEENRFFWSREIGEWAADRLIPSAAEILGQLTDQWTDRSEGWKSKISQLQESVRVSQKHLDSARGSIPENPSRVRAAVLMRDTVLKQLDATLKSYQTAWLHTQQSYRSKGSDLRRVHRELLQEVSRLDDRFVFGGATLANATYFAFPVCEEPKEPGARHEILAVDVYLILIQWRGSGV